MLRPERPMDRQDGSTEVLRFLVVGSRGGATRRRIMGVLQECPQNAYRISRMLRLNYGTVTSHLRVLERYGLVIPIALSRYNRGYSIPPALRSDPSFVELLNGAGVESLIGRRTSARIR